MVNAAATSVVTAIVEAMRNRIEVVMTILVGAIGM
jgi:hypothetical protein